MDATRSDAAAPSSSSRDMYLVVHNISKKANVGTLSRCATAFGVKEIILVGSRHYNSFGSHGAHDHIPFRYFSALEECKAWLHERGVELIGVEICEGARSVAEHPFSGSAAFMLGNEGAGMSDKQLALCDRFIYIPQHGPGTASLNVAVAAALVLHHYALWAGYGERERSGYKYVVAERPAHREGKRGVVPLTEEERAALREERARRAEGTDDASDDGAIGEIFDRDA